MPKTITIALLPHHAELLRNLCAMHVSTLAYHEEHGGLEPEAVKELDRARGLRDLLAEKLTEVAS
jgi:hypothetical protein